MTIGRVVLTAATIGLSIVLGYERWFGIAAPTLKVEHATYKKTASDTHFKGMRKLQKAQG